MRLLVRIRTNDDDGDGDDDGIGDGDWFVFYDTQLKTALTAQDV